MEDTSFVSVIDAVSRYFGVDPESIVPMSKNWRSDIALARDYAVVIVHDHLGVSISRTASLFGFTTRNVSRITCRLRYLCSFGGAYADAYNSLCSIIDKEGE